MSDHENTEQMIDALLTGLDDRRERLDKLKEGLASASKILSSPSKSRLLTFLQS